jgi:hypothetical protein
MNIAEKKILQANLARFLVDEIFNTITEEDILRVEGGVWYYKNKPLTPGQVEALRNQATVFYKSDLWKILKDELQWRAQSKGMEKATSVEDIIGSKMLQYLVDVIDTRLKAMVKEK